MFILEAVATFCVLALLLLNRVLVMEYFSWTLRWFISLVSGLSALFDETGGSSQVQQPHQVHDGRPASNLSKFPIEDYKLEDILGQGERGRGCLHRLQYRADL